MLDGRVKTLHPKIHGGLLGAPRPPRAHRARWREHGIEPIDLVVVNLYPFEATVAQPRRDARGGDREHRHRRPVDAALGGEEPRARRRVLVDPADYAACSPSCARAAARCRPRRNRAPGAKVFAAHRALRRRDRRLPRRARPRRRFGADARTGAARRRSTCATARTRTSAPRSTATSSTSPSRCTARSSRTTTSSTSTRRSRWSAEFRGDADAAVAILKHNTPCGVGLGRDAARGLASARSRPIPSRRSAASSSSNRAVRPRARAGGRRDLHRGADRARFDADALELLQKKKNRAPAALASRRRAPDGRARPAARRRRRARAGAPIARSRTSRPAQVATQRAADRRRAARARLRAGGREARQVERDRVRRRRPHARDRRRRRPRASMPSATRARARPRASASRCAGSALASDAFFPFPDGLEVAAAAGATAVVQPGGSDARRRGDRGRRRARRRDGLHRRAPLPALERRCASWSSAAAGASTRSPGSSRRARASRRCSCAPGNAGIAALARVRADVAADDVDGARRASRASRRSTSPSSAPRCRSSLGLADRFARRRASRSSARRAAAAQLEGSKAFAKELMRAPRVPTARLRRVRRSRRGARATSTRSARRCVVKADGLAAGKGVVVCDDRRARRSRRSTR